jgi:polyphenol oxidase
VDLIRPDWPAPDWVRACSTTRTGGVSSGPFAGLNLGDHVGDDPACVDANRAMLRERLAVPAEPLWLKQVHGCQVAHGDTDSMGCEADASVARAPGQVCAVMTADCLPILACDPAGRAVAAIHAGWRGLAGGVLEAALAELGGDPAVLLIWLGPAIGPDAFEVGPEVRESFLARDPSVSSAFRPSPSGKWLADLYALARARLAALGARCVYGGTYCTFADSERFFSFRRDGITGRMASLIWIDGSDA